MIANTTASGPVKEIAPMTNAKGEFSLSGLPPGEYTLRANAAGYAPKDKKVSVEGTKTSSVDFVMTK
ncbi:Cna protein B-type domain protein [compost metagenome]